MSVHFIELLETRLETSLRALTDEYTEDKEVES